MDEQTNDPSIDTNLGISRRSVLRRGAVVGGTLVWAAPAVQSISRTALAAGTPVDPADDCCTADAFGMRVELLLLGLGPETFIGRPDCTIVSEATVGTLAGEVFVTADGVCSTVDSPAGGPCTGSASVATLDIQYKDVLGISQLRVQAETLTADATATCDPCSVRGTSTIQSLALSGALVLGGPITVDASVLASACNLDVAGLGLVKVNEQTCDNGRLMVNALHVNVAGVLDVVASHAEAEVIGQDCCMVCG